MALNARNLIEGAIRACDLIALRKFSFFPSRQVRAGADFLGVTTSWVRTRRLQVMAIDKDSRGP